MAEGAEIAALMAPSHIEADEDGNAAALWVQPQIIGEVGKAGRPRPNKADLPEVRIPADIIVVAIGQGIEIQGFEQAGVPIKRGTFVAGLSGQVGDMDNLFAGGDCVTALPAPFAPSPPARWRRPTSTYTWASSMRSRWSWTSRHRS